MLKPGKVAPFSLSPIGGWVCSPCLASELEGSLQGSSWKGVFLPRKINKAETVPLLTTDLAGPVG